MKIPFIDGRDFRAGDTYPGVAIVNEAFAKQYFDGENPVGKSFERVEAAGVRSLSDRGPGPRCPLPQDMREPIRPTAYVPFPSIDAKGALQPVGRGDVRRAHVQLRTRSRWRPSCARKCRARGPNSASATSARRGAEPARRPSANGCWRCWRSSSPAVALLLAGIGLYGVLDYSVLQRRREIGIRMAIGAQAGDIARRVTADVFSMVLAGAVAGLALGMASVRYIESLLYQVKATDLAMLALPSLTILAAALLAALPAVIRAVRIDPVRC